MTCVTGPAGAVAQHELRGVQQLDREPAADLHLTRIERRVDARAALRRPVAHASEPCSSRSAIGVTTLPFDFDIFLRSGSSTQPEIAAFFHGRRSSRDAIATRSRRATCE
jgi:hypothetical protein